MQRRSPEHSLGVPPGVPGQQVWSTPPHACAGSVTSTHSVPVTVPVASRVISQPSVGASHALVPSQQVSPALPHAWHRPSAGLQTPSSRHVKPAQHTPPGAPQSGVVGSTSSGS